MADPAMRPARGGDAVFGYPDVGRYGLAHSLMAWARCTVWCDRHGATQVAPIWLRPRLGPYLRRERDKREYFRYFRAGDDVSGWRRLWLLGRHPRHAAAVEQDPEPAQLAAGTVVVFRNEVAANDRKFFGFVKGEHALLRRRLVEITRPAYRPAPPAGPFLAVHVRLGDFQKPASEDELNQGLTNRRLPMPWFVAMTRAMRERAGPAMPIVVFSDGSDAELAPLLALPGVVRSPSDAAITDLLTMAQSRLMISSASGLCRFGSFLGQVPRICFPGQRIVSVLDDPAREIECGTADEARDFLQTALTDPFAR